MLVYSCITDNSKTQQPETANIYYVTVSASQNLGPERLGTAGSGPLKRLWSGPPPWGLTHVIVGGLSSAPRGLFQRFQPGSWFSQRRRCQRCGSDSLLAASQKWRAITSALLCGHVSATWYNVTETTQGVTTLWVISEAGYHKYCHNESVLFSFRCPVHFLKKGSWPTLT